ncbi:MAG: hypothetical protein IPH80_23600 [Myxococcales bacterium]|nr:hypothetical protein [Myxococcales bacterium]
MAGGRVIALPAALAAWADELAALPTELALALAPWVGRLALVVGPMAERRSLQAGEPDGFTGLARRGSYERLVASEWALAEHFPEEFVRRAAAGEHLFHELARRSHHGAQRAVAIVSAGPGQLGAPRLAQLALLVVLARRARVAGADFAWGVLEDPTRTLTVGVDVDAVTRLLAARTTRCDDGDPAAWAAALAAERGCEAWWIGGAAELAAARAAGARTAVIADVLEPGVRALEVEVQHRGPARRLRLALPDDDACARLLRAPVPGVAGRRTAQTAGRATAIQFGAGGRRLLVTLDGGRVECWPVPNSPRDMIGRARPWTPPPGARLVAIGAEQRTVLAVIAPTGVLDRVEVATPTGAERVQVRLPPEVRLGATGPQRVGACGLVDLGGVGRALVFELDEALLIVDSFPGTQRAYQTAARRLHVGAGWLMAAVIHGRQVVWIAKPDEGIDVWLADRDGARQVATADEPNHVPTFGHDLAAVGVWGPVATATGERCTLLADGRNPRHVPITGGLVGVAGGRALVQVDDRHLAWQDPERRVAWPATNAAIVDVATATAVPYVAVLTVAGEIIVRHTQRDDLLLRLVPGARSPA